MGVTRRGMILKENCQRERSYYRNLWIHSEASDSDFPRPVHCAVPAMRVNGMMANQISDPTISNIDESSDVNVGMTPTTRGKRYSKPITRKIYLAMLSLIM